MPVWGDLGAAVFVDGGNVFERTTQLDLGELRGSVGFGVRYRSPIGPVRLDLGFKLDRRIVGDRLEGREAFTSASAMRFDDEHRAVPRRADADSRAFCVSGPVLLLMLLLGGQAPIRAEVIDRILAGRQRGAGASE